MSDTPTVQTFTTTLLATGGNNVGLPVPDDVVAAFGRGRRVPVVVTVDGGYTYRTTVSSMGGRFLVSFNAETRAATGRGAGDEVGVRLELDDAPRTVETPAALATALAADPVAAAAWERLSPSRQKAHALSVDGARTQETRDRRVAKVLEALAG
ncbi:YdeI/OmpD-associated family protein [Isoptericola sp. NPDC019693]|uniref:YdeI/OmpD-associated family protein n=1 Tax=Isoptericola sp. NPDC019693 TaxID=3364009 RepID=UPI003797708F